VAGKSQSGKSKRPQSERKKLARVKCRANARQGHELAGRQQELRHQHNLRLIKDHEPVPWEQARAERAERRHMTCGKCRILFEDGTCSQCGGTLNLKGAWEKKQ
jgi:hypothetical protein